MRLGGYFVAESVNDMDNLCSKLDHYGLSAIQAPSRLSDMEDDICIEFGERAKKLNICIGEAGMWQNFFVEDLEMRQERITLVKTMLQKADLMKCDTVVSLVGSKFQVEPPITPHPDNYTTPFQDDFREIVLRILDGLDLEHTTYTIEPWHNSFFYQPEEINAFIDSIDHPNFGLHLDQMNMVSQDNYFNTTELINLTFDRLSNKIISVHLKDVRCDGQYMMLKYDEVMIGDGVLDYPTFLNRLSELPEDITCFCEHLSSEEEYADNFNRLHDLADSIGLGFKKRSER